MDKFLKVVGTVVVVAVIVALLSAVLAYPTKWLVNYLFTPGTLTALFGMPQINLMHAFCLNWLCGILFKNTNTSKS